MLIDNARLNHVTGTILGGAIEVHRVIGPGLLESPYMPCLQYELTERGLSFVAQAPIALTYKTLQLDAVYKCDLLVEDLVIVEVKCVEALAPVHRAQLLTYMRLMNKPAGLLINFNVARLMDGVQRVLNTYSQARRSTEKTVQHGDTKTR
jgi:GxxExxY protein